MVKWKWPEVFSLCQEPKKKKNMAVGTWGGGWGDWGQEVRLPPPKYSLIGLLFLDQIIIKWQFLCLNRMKRISQFLKANMNNLAKISRFGCFLSWFWKSQWSNFGAFLFILSRNQLYSSQFTKLSLSPQEHFALPPYFGCSINCSTITAFPSRF